MATEREVDIEELRAHLAQTPVGRRIDEIVIHHTWRPTAAEYRGIETVRGVRRYHMGVRGWSDNGYHVMIGPDGRIFLCRPLARSGAHVSGRNAHTVGVAMIANFDSEEPWEYGGMHACCQVVAALMERFDRRLRSSLTTKAIRFHREFAPKTCPGLKLGLSAFRSAVVDAGAEASEMRPKIVLLPGNALIDCRAQVEDGVTRVDLRALVEALGYRVHDHLKDQGKVYVERVDGAG